MKIEYDRLCIYFYLDHAEVWYRGKLFDKVPIKPGQTPGFVMANIGERVDFLNYTLSHPAPEKSRPGETVG